MTRQIALGAIIAFAVTVLALSVWEPKPSTEAPAPTPAAAPAPLGPSNIMLKPAMLRPASLRTDVPHRKLAERGQPLLLAVEADAGTAP